MLKTLTQMLCRLAVCLLLALAARPAASQDLGTYTDTLSGQQPFILRSFVQPQSVVIFRGQQQLDSTDYVLDYRFGRLWVPEATENDSLVVHYRTWRLGIKDQYTRPLVRVVADSVGSDTTAAAGTPRTLVPPAGQGMSLTRSGSITRGVLAGNNRDAIIESGLRLRLAGNVARDVRVQAVLTDESTPILPEGTTQRLTELDRVYIEVASPYGTAELGDFEAGFETGEFAQLRRKVQGVGLQAPLPVPSAEGSFEMLGASARGTFRRQKLSSADGVQGPYRLTGAQNEQFIFIIPGSEEIFLDGRRMQRGRSADYVIDYASGELTFTANRLIRSHNRIVAEFQYRTTEFSRTLLGTTSDVSLWQRSGGSARATLGATYLREADGRTLSEAFGLSAEDEALLQVAGDSLAIRSGATPVSYDPEAPYVQYARIDTVVADAMYEVFAPVSSRPMSGQVYRVHFTRVEAGQGSYVRQGQTTNGLAFTWRGTGHGEYEPVRIVPRPAEHTMLDLRGSVSPIRHVELFGEWARSRYDANRFSRLHKGDDGASAYLAGARLNPLSVGLGTVAGQWHRRHTGAGFGAFSRIRPVEFERLWNLDSERTAATRERVSVARESVDEATATWQATKTSAIEATAGSLVLGKAFRAGREELSVRLQEAGWPTASYSRIQIRSEDTGRQASGRWVRQDIRLGIRAFDQRLAPLMRIKLSDKQFWTANRDSLERGSKDYVQLIPQVRWHAPVGAFGASSDVRIERHVQRGRLVPHSTAVTWDFNFDVKPAPTLTMEGRVGVRRRSIGGAFTKSGATSVTRAAAIRWSGRFRPWQRALQLNWHYEALSERTPSLQEIYIRTGPELGEFVWVDANGNGVAELDEFLPETTQDEGNYVRTLVPSDSLQAVTGLQARIALELDPARRWSRSSAGWQRILRSVSLRTVINVQEKSRNPATLDIYLLRMGSFQSPVHTLKGLLSVQQDLHLFRGHPRWSASGSYRHVQSLSALAAGTESRAVDEVRGQARVKAQERWTLGLTVSEGTRRTESQAFASRSYDITTRTVAPALTYSPSSALQTTLTVAYVTKQAREARGTLWKVPLEAQYSQAGRINVAMRLEAASVVLRGAPSGHGLAFFELTDGRGAGRSLLWSVRSWYQLSRVMRATVTYNGRNPSGAPSIHTVRMQLSALF